MAGNLGGLGEMLESRSVPRCVDVQRLDTSRCLAVVGKPPELLGEDLAQICLAAIKRV